MFAAAIITLAGIAFGIFVGEDRALGLQHRRGDDVLRRDQFKLVPLAIELRGDSLVHRWIRLAELAAKERRVESICGGWGTGHDCRSEEHTSELQSLMRISYDVVCLKKKHNETNK